MLGPLGGRVTPLPVVLLRFLRFGAVCLFAALGLSCASVTSNTAVLSDSSHLGTPYSGTIRDAHTLYCLGRGVVRDSSTLLLLPVGLVFLVDLPLSVALDTVLLPFDVVLEPEARPLVVGEGGCKLIGM
jgi:uncharacterized protein YceK